MAAPDWLLDVAIAATLWASVLSTTLRPRSGSILLLADRRPLLLQVLVLDIILIPVVVRTLSVLLQVPSAPATGLLIVGAASAGPLGLAITGVARGSVDLALELIVVLELANIAIIPLWVTLLLPEGAAPPLLDVLRPLLLLVLAPAVVGTLVSRTWPGQRRWFLPWLDKVAAMSLLVVVALILGRHLPIALAAIGDGVLPVAAGTVIFALGAGWLAGRPNRPDRIAVSHVTGVRANAPALAVAVAAFPDQPAVSEAIVVFGLVSVLLLLPAAVFLRRGPVVAA